MRNGRSGGWGGAGAAAEKESFVQRNFACNLHISLANDLTWLQIWQLQVAVAAAPPLTPSTTTFPCPGTTPNSASSTSAAAAIYAFKWQHGWWWWRRRRWWWGSWWLLYLVSCIFYLQDAFCSCADCQVLPSCSYEEHNAGRIIMPHKL